MLNMRSKVIKLAHDVPELRKHLVPLLRTAMEFDTPEALKKYLDDHPAADKSNHSVNTDDDKKGPSTTKSKPAWDAEEAIKKSTKRLLPENIPHFQQAVKHAIEPFNTDFTGGTDKEREQAFAEFSKDMADNWTSNNNNFPDGMKNHFVEMAKMTAQILQNNKRSKELQSEIESSTHDFIVNPPSHVERPSNYQPTQGMDWSTTGILGSMGGVVALTTVLNNVFFTNLPMSSDAKTYVAAGIAALLISPVVDIIRNMKSSSEDDFHKWLKKHKDKLEAAKNQGEEGLAKALTDMYADMRPKYMLQMVALGEKIDAKGK
jgi:hypothetical protein